MHNTGLLQSSQDFALVRPVRGKPLELKEKINFAFSWMMADLVVHLHGVWHSSTMFIATLISLIASSHALVADDLKTGDIILQSVPCLVCQLIEEEEKSPYSHIGVVIKQPSGEPMVLESWGYVQNTSLSLFLSKRKKGSPSLVMRPLDEFKLEQISDQVLMDHFLNFFAGKNYDPYFLWNNRNENGEMYYCSEFVAKFMNPFLKKRLLPKSMHFETNRNAWMNYFNGMPPDGMPGISPGDFERSPLFKNVGLL